MQESEAYEYRGAFSCEDHFDELQTRRDIQRAEIIEESKHLTEKFRGLDMGDSSIGRANREILKADIEIASKETGREKEYRNV